jgi:hypothetical protein
VDAAFHFVTEANATTWTFEPDPNGADLGNAALSPDALVADAQAQTLSNEADAASLTFDELSQLYPGFVWPSWFSEASATGDGGSRPDIPSQDAAVTDSLTERTASSLFDEFSALYPGFVWPTSPAQATTPTDGLAAADTSARDTMGNNTIPDQTPPVADSPDAAAPDAGATTSSLTYADLSAQYPGIIWPADWYLL